MNEGLTRASEWVYHGVWAILVQWFRVPKEPPQLPIVNRKPLQIFRPSSGFLGYLKFEFWILAVVLGGSLLILWLIVFVALPWAGALLAPVVVSLVVLPGVVAYVALYVRYDSTWYVMSDRSLRIRRGIWVIHETTITFENIQNVTVDQGPVQRWFGIANVLVQTAGGGGGGPQQHGAGASGGHHGLIEGIDNAPEIRDLIMSRLKLSRSAGLGDDGPSSVVVAEHRLSADHLRVLREIRDAARQLVAPRP